MKWPIAACLILLCSLGFAAEKKEFYHPLLLSDGTPVEITVIDLESQEERVEGAMARAAAASAALDAELEPHGFAELLQRSRPRTPIAVSAPLFELLKKARNLSILTNGWFDIAAPSAPSSFVKRDYRRILLDESAHTIAFKSRKMKLDLSWLLRGAVVDAAIASLIRDGIADAKVEAGPVTRHIGRDLYTPWSLTLELPHAAESHAHRAFKYNLSNIATATIAPVAQASAIIDPKKHGPIQPFLTRATLLANDAVTAIAFALAVAPFEPLTAIRYIDKYPEVEGIVVGADGTLFISESLLAATPSTGDELRDDRAHPDGGSSDLKRKRQEEESDLR